MRRGSDSNPEIHNVNRSWRSQAAARFFGRPHPSLPNSQYALLLSVATADRDRVNASAMEGLFGSAPIHQSFASLATL